MEKEFVPYKLALRLKKLGFDEGCFGYYYIGAEKSIGLSHQIEGKGFQVWTNSLLVLFDKNTTNISAPTFSQTFEWMREKYGLHQSIIKYSGSKIYWCQIEMISDKKDRSGEYEVIYATSLSNFTKYRDAEIACLKKLLEIVEQKEN